MMYSDPVLLEIQARKIEELEALSELLSKHLNEALLLLQKLAELYAPKT